MLTRRRLLIASGALVASCSVAPDARRPTDVLVPLYARPSANEWPEEFYRLPGNVQDMYRYAAANPDVLRYMPCYCGCVAAGHASNLDCYIAEQYRDGRVRLDTMSFG